MIKIYTISSCTSCKKAKTWLNNHQLPYKEQNLGKEPLTKEEILSCYQDYVTACKWFEAAGWEGVMIHCGHGWLPAQFLSPQYNKRTDEYGGSFENRARFTVDLLKWDLIL